MIQGEEKIVQFRLSVCWGLSSDVDGALGEQLRCRAFRLHHYCSPSSRSTNTHARTHTCMYAHMIIYAHAHKYTQPSYTCKSCDCCISASASLRSNQGFPPPPMPSQANKTHLHMLIFKTVWQIFTQLRHNLEHDESSKTGFLLCQ